MIWNPIFPFFRKSKVVVSEIPLGFSWKFREVSFSLPTVNYFECLLTDGENVSAGYAEDQRLSIALKKAFCESVERYFFERFDVFFPEISRPTTTNGFAAGPTLRFSTERSVLELIERKIVSDAWYLEKGWHQINTPNFKFENLVKNGFEIRIFEIKNDSEIKVYCGAVFHPNFGIYFDSVAESKIAPQNSERLYNSLLKGASTLASKCHDERIKTELVEKMLPSEIGSIYHRNGLEKIWGHFLTKTITQAPNEEIKIENETKEIHIHQLVKGDFVFPFVTYSTNPVWKPFGWGKNTMYGTNPWHLPLV
jgi:hypothetical protein